MISDVAGPDDGPGKGLGEGGEQLHYWVCGKPWTYESGPGGEPTGEDAEWLNEAIARVGAVVGGRWTNEAAEHWGGENPWGLPFFIVTHRPEDEPREITSRSGERRRGGRGAREGGGRRQDLRDGRRRRDPPGVLEAGLVDELSIIVAPVVLGGGKHLFDGFTKPLELEHIGVRQSRFATFVDYRVKRA